MWHGLRSICSYAQLWRPKSTEHYLPLQNEPSSSFVDQKYFLYKKLIKNRIVRSPDLRLQLLKWFIPILLGLKRWTVPRPTGRRRPLSLMATTTKRRTEKPPLNRMMKTPTVHPSPGTWTASLFSLKFIDSLIRTQTFYGFINISHNTCIIET